MAFVRKPKQSTFKWPVSVQYPTDGGRFETETFDAEFRRIGRAEFQKLIDKGDLDLVEAVLAGWDGIKDEADKDIPFSQAALKEFLDDPFFVRGLIQAYLESLEGAKSKN